MEETCSYFPSGMGSVMDQKRIKLQIPEAVDSDMFWSSDNTFEDRPILEWSYPIWLLFQP